MPLSIVVGSHQAGTVLVVFAMLGLAMRVIVIIASAGRRETLSRMLQHLARQQRRPDEVILPVANQDDAPQTTPPDLNVRVLLAPRGSCSQRNAALDAAMATADIISFLDDDFLPAPSYLARVEAAFRDNADYSVVHGRPVADGAQSAGYSFEQGLSLLDAALAAGERPLVVRDHAGAYGCNMSVRAAHVGAVRFDERLALYGWQEDIDFSARVGRAGRIVSLSHLIGVHLGVKSGRVSGVRLGYAQVVNPLYLARKGSMAPLHAAHLVIGNLMANAVRSFRPEPWVDRRGRLYGNAVALARVMRGRIEPERVVDLK